MENTLSKLNFPGIDPLNVAPPLITWPNWKHSFSAQPTKSLAPGIDPNGLPALHAQDPQRIE